MSYVVIYGYSTYGSGGQYAQAIAEDFQDNGTRIGTALGTWNIAYEGGNPIKTLLTRAASPYLNYSEIKLADAFYNKYKIDIDQWLNENPVYASRVTGSFIPLKGSISFASTPAGAEIFIDGADQGVKTPNTAMNVPAGSHAYVLKLAGYNDYTGTVSVIAGQTAAVTVTLTLTCVPTWKCEIPLNGYETDGCGNRRANPACNPPPACVPGWKCEIPLNGYETDGCGNRRVNPACNPPQAGNISFVSTPAGAGIFLDGHDQGAITPNTVSSIPVGIHAYTLKLAGYNDVTGTVSVVSGQTAAVTVTLIASCVPVWNCELPLNGNEADGCGNRRANPSCNPPQIGRISFASTPPGAEIYIDGADQNIKTPVTISDIPTGTHTYTLKQTGYIDVTGTVDVVLNQTTAASVTLIPVAKPGIGTGTILTLLLAAGAVGAVALRSRQKTTPAPQRT